MVKEISYAIIGTNKFRIIFRKFKDIHEAYQFAQENCRQGEYISHII